MENSERVENRVRESAQVAEAEPRHDEMELRQILDLLPQHVTVFGATGENLYINPAGLDYFGLTAEKWLAADIWSFFHPDDRERVKGEGVRQISMGIPAEVEARVRRSDGQYRWFLIRRNPLRNEHGRITRWFASGIDIEDRKQAEDRLKHENVALVEVAELAAVVAAQPDPEGQLTDRAEPVEAGRLARELVDPPPRERGHHGAEAHPRGRDRDRRKRDPRIGERFEPGRGSRRGPR